jgi:hypothetical protein
MSVNLRHTLPTSLKGYNMKQYYLIYNSTNKIQYIRKFDSSMDARNFVINNLDLSMNWSYDRFNYLLESGDIESVNLF